MHCHESCYLKSFEHIRMTHSRTIKIYDYGWNGAYIVMHDAIWNRLQTYALSTAEPSRCMIIAQTELTLSWAMLFETVCKRTHQPFQDHQNLGVQLRPYLHCRGRCYLTSFANVRMIHSMTINFFDYCWDGVTVCVVMDDATRNRLQKYAWSNLAPSKFTTSIIPETALAWSLTMLFEIVWKHTQCPLQIPQKLWL